MVSKTDLQNNEKEGFTPPFHYHRSKIIASNEVQILFNYLITNRKAIF